MEDPEAGEASRSQDAESHFVTIVKCDIVESTRLWSRLSRPDGLTLIRGFKAAVEAAVTPSNVTLEWEGDGALIAFGYPEVRVDAAEAAVRTGLALIDAVRSVDVVPGVRLEVRVGIASGLVTIDLLSHSVDGLPINKAERLKTVAALKPARIPIGHGVTRAAVDDDRMRKVLGVHVRGERLEIGVDLDLRFPVGG
jgi:class 3 adenylate cyclase